VSIVQGHGGADASLVLATDFTGDANLMAFDPRGTRLAVASPDGDHVLFFDPHTGRESGCLRRVHGVVQMAFLSPEVLLLVHGEVCSRYDLRKRQLATIWQDDKAAYPRGAYGALASPDGRVVALGATSGRMLLYQVGQRRVRHIARTYYLGTSSHPVAFSTDNRYAVFRLGAEENFGRVLLVLDVATGRRLRTYEVGSALEVACDGGRLAVIDDLWKETKLYELEGGEDPVTVFPVGFGLRLRFVEGTESVEVLGLDGSVQRLHQGKSRAVRPACTPPCFHDLVHFVPSPDWSLLAANKENQVVVWRADGARPAARAGRD
jgi:hypothetical protein